MKKTPNLQRDIILAQISNNLASSLVTIFVTMFVLSGAKGIADVARGSIMISLLVLGGFFLVNWGARFLPQMTHMMPIRVSAAINIIIGFSLLLWPEMAWIAYGLSGLNVGLYYAGANMVALHDIDPDIRPRHTGIVQFVSGVLGVLVPLGLGMSFANVGTSTTYTIVFLSIVLLGAITLYAGTVARSGSHFAFHSFRQLVKDFPVINPRYLVAAGCIGAGALRSQIEVILPKSIDLSEANISFMMSGVKIVSLLAMLLCSFRLKEKKYAALLLGMSLIGMAMSVRFVLHFVLSVYIVYALVGTFTTTLAFFSISIMSPRRMRAMAVHTRSTNLVGEIAMAAVRVTIALVMLWVAGIGADLHLVGQVVLLMFSVCLLVGAIVYYRNANTFYE